MLNRRIVGVRYAIDAALLGVCEDSRGGMPLRSADEGCNVPIVDCLFIALGGEFVPIGVLKSVLAADL
jgi:hypothetical protein